MAHTNQTPNYELSQFLGTDKPAWLVDYNGDMEKIDLGMKVAKDVADAAKVEADQGAIDIAAVTVTANSADVKASGALSNISDAYDSTSTYSVGDYVIYNNLLYRCIASITVPEAFDGNHWERTTVDAIVSGLNTTLSAVDDAINTMSVYSEDGVASFRRYLDGHLIEVNVVANDVAGGTTLYTLDANYRPTKTINIATPDGRVIINVDGTIVYSGPNNAAIRVHTLYLK